MSPSGRCRGRRHDDLDRRLGALARLDHVIPLAARRVGEHLGLAREEIGEEAHVVRVIRDDEEIERARELRGLAARGHDLLAAREAVGVARIEPAPNAPASIENAVCRCVSPKNGRVGNLRSA